MEIVQDSSNLEPEGGNSINPSGKQISPSEKWCFTIFNYTKVQYEEIIELFIKMNWYYVIGEEICTTTNKPHLQGFVMRRDRKKFRLTKLDKICTIDNIKQSRNFRAKGSPRENFEYCSKDNIYKTNMNNLFRDSYNRNFLPDKKFMIEILEMLKCDINDRNIYWYWGPQGSCKTWFCKYLVEEQNAIVLGLRAHDNKNAILQYLIKYESTPNLIIINIGYDKDLDKVNYSMLEEIKDMLFYSGKYEGGMICGPNPNLIIFSNGKPITDNKKFIVKKII